MSFKIVQALFGELIMRSSPGGGSTFVFWLPLDARAIPTAEAEVALPAGAGER